MAGIGFELQKLIQVDRPGARLRGVLHAAVIAAGPWLLTCLALALMPALSQGVIGHTALLRFHSVAVLAFSVSLVAAGPFVMVVSRCLGDAMHAGDLDATSSMLLATLTRVFAWLAPIGALLFGLVLDLPAADRMLGFLLMLACGGVWVVAGMLSALRSHGIVAVALALGLIVALVVGHLMLPRWHEVGLLTGLLLGQALTLTILTAQMLIEYPLRDSPEPMFDLRAATERFRHLAWAGFLYSAGLWVDKWLMWLAPGAERASRGVWSYPVYEGAMFLAFLTIVPVLAIFLADIETRFHLAYQRWFRSIEGRANLRTLHRHHGTIVRITASSFKRLSLVQATIAVIAILASPAIVGWFGGGDDVASVFRFGVFGAGFHVLLIISMAALAYFDQRQWLLTVAGTFFATNVIATLIGISMGHGWHGWGYAVAAVTGFALAYYAAARAIAKLPYMTFVGANPSVRERPEAPDDEAASPLANARRPGSVLVGGALNQTL